MDWIANMDTKKNCWEIKNCGRQHGGYNTAELGICPASQSNQYDGINNGKFAGRYCWKVAGTLCEGQVQGIHVSKIVNCAKCDFFNIVNQEEGDNFKL